MTHRTNAANATHLHRDDCPRALTVLSALLAARRHDPVGLDAIGYRPTEVGAWVDWDALQHSWLSSTERAAVLVAQGVAAAERQGGWPPRIQRALVEAVSSL